MYINMDILPIQVKEAGTCTNVTCLSHHIYWIYVSILMQSLALGDKAKININIRTSLVGE